MLRNCSRTYKTSAFVLIITLAAGLFYGTLRAQRTPEIGASELIQTLDRLNVLGSLLMIAAHPDDENNAVLAYYSRGRHMRTAYLSATRGEGGQNLIGTEQYDALGLIRTQELLAARRIDRGEQYFTRSYDFGFTKTPDEALQKWGRERFLSDLVRDIRRFRPDVIVDRFPIPPGTGGHGQHTATGYLAPTAFEAAADPGQFPEQLREGLQPWRARRILWNTFSFTRQQQQEEAKITNKIPVDTGAFDPVLGKSYAEIAAESRSQHQSQGFGAAERKGTLPQYFVVIAGEKVTGPPISKTEIQGDLFQGIDTTWGRVPGASRLGRLLAQARREFDPVQPEKILPLLVESYGEMEHLSDPWIEVKRPELLHAIGLAAGLGVEAGADRWDVVPGSTVAVTLSVVNRSHFELAWEGVDVGGSGQASARVDRALADNKPEETKLTVTVPAGTPYTQPYWLREPRQGDSYGVADPRMIGLPENPPDLEATFTLRTADGVRLPFRVPVEYRWVDRVNGEQARLVEVVPPVSVAFPLTPVLFAEPAPRRVQVRVTSNTGAAKGTVSLEVPAGWKAEPASASFEFTERNQQAGVTFEITPPAEPAVGEVLARAVAGDATVTAGLETIHYLHIGYQTMLVPARARLEHFDVRMTARNIGYVMGAGDEVPQALEQLGASVHLLTAEDLAGGDLSRFDAIVTGVRAINTRSDLVAARQRLFDYVRSGGTLVEQYNTVDGGGAVSTGRNAALLAPYPATASNARVTVEDAPITLPNPDLPILHHPNEISAQDFDGWVQERGLYFMSKWDDRYKPVFACNDPGEKPQLGGMLYARYGKGVYIYTAYSWFRQLPAGVPGAYRIFSNLVSAGHTLGDEPSQ